MSYDSDLKETFGEIFEEAFPTGATGEYPNIVANPLKEVYTPTDTLSDDKWDNIVKMQMITFTFMLRINENVVDAYLGFLRDNWKRGGYKCSKDFCDRVDELFDNLREIVAKRNKLTFRDEELYDELLESYNKVHKQRTYNFSVADKLLNEKALEWQDEIEDYLRQRVEHNFELTEEMIAFKDVDTLETEERFNPIPQELMPWDEGYEPPTPNLQVYDNHSLEQIKKAQSQEELPEGHPPVEPVEDLGDNSLYIVADDLDKEFEEKKDTEEFKWCNMNRMDYYRWASLKYTYKNGKTFTAEGLQGTLNSAKSRAKLDSKND